jgi:hypothetical protein
MPGNAQRGARMKCMINWEQWKGNGHSVLKIISSSSSSGRIEKS